MPKTEQQRSLKKKMLSNTSRNKGNQTMKFGLPIEKTVRNIFLLKSCCKLG